MVLIQIMAMCTSTAPTVITINQKLLTTASIDVVLADGNVSLYEKCCNTATPAVTDKVPADKGA